jgi:hypothetical protein
MPLNITVLYCTVLYRIVLAKKQKANHRKYKIILPFFNFADFKRDEIFIHYLSFFVHSIAIPLFYNFCCIYAYVGKS